MTSAQIYFMVSLVQFVFVGDHSLIFWIAVYVCCDGKHVLHRTENSPEI
jgi:hypothetical protein